MDYGDPVAIIGQYETSSAAAVRAAAAQTGYNIREPKHIVTFFPSPAVISERIFLYYAEVGHDDKLEGGSDGEGEDIDVREIPLDDFLEQVKSKYIEDPKVMIGGLSLQEELKNQARRPLDHSTVKYSLVKHPDLFVGYKTGPIADVKDVSVCVNSENEDMIMDRFIGRTISANIRYLGADRDEADNVTEDIINEELISAVGPRGPVRIGTVIETSPGALAVTHGVKAVLHVATVRGVGAGQGVRADLDDIARCTRNVLMKAHDKNRRFLLAERFKRFSLINRLLKRKNCESILIPMIGGGDGGMHVDKVVPKLMSAAIKYFEEYPTTTLKEIYFLAFTAEHKSACDRELERLRKQGTIQ